MYTIQEVKNSSIKLVCLFCLHQMKQLYYICQNDTLLVFQREIHF
jgi:hypothetical protein